ncbi:hypothetical protein [Streptomyces sp. NEAU-W12]|uniref:hypothetical protein n=1 Tax=Streptomyces sp. NEAU-W12 TaxID=2994668 RepID=UPI00224B990C|nr:hypothetical protein [Streptomyces sp. NEAU-W12]MCX2924270.1 hypothetical protein [Streptomyces sp. NEAU-W12]
MEYRRAVIPAVAGGLMVTLLLWWAGASADALHLEGAADVLGHETVARLRGWLLPWAYEPSGGTTGGSFDGTDASRYLGLHHTAIQIRFAAVFVLYAAGALLLLRRLPPERGRTWAALLALWAWGLVAGTLAVTVSAPWLIAAQGHGSYQFLPQLASLSSAGRPIVVPVALAAAAWAVLVARPALKGAGPQPREDVPARAALLAATVGTAVVAVSLVVLSYQSNAATLQTAFTGGGLLAEPGDLLRQWLLLGAWSGPAGTPLGDWLLYRLGDVLLLVVVWCALRWLPGLLTRVSVPAMAAGGVCAVVLGLLAEQALRMTTDGTQMRSGLLYAASGLGEGVTAALLWGALAGVAATVTLRAAGARAPSRPV